MKKLMPVVAAVLFVATTAFATPNGEDKPRRRGRPDYAALFAKLELTPEQRQQIEEIQRTSKARVETYLNGTNELMEELRAARAAKDTARVATLEADLEVQRTEMKELQNKEAEEMLNVLTAEQRAQFEKVKAERAERLEQQRKNDEAKRN
jgi:Spy/CpxP family protein refolding chaperone